MACRMWVPRPGLFVCYDISNIFEEFRSVNLQKVSQFGFLKFPQDWVEIMHFWLEYCITDVFLREQCC